jgi:hypothetical protein
MNQRVLTVVCIFTIAVGAVGSARAIVVPFDIVPDVPVTPAGVIPGGTLIGSPFTYYNIQFDVNGGGADINIRTARASEPGGPGVDQVVSDGLNSASIVKKGSTDSYLNTPFALGDLIGDGLDEFARAPDQFNVINDGGFQMYNPGDNFLGFKLPNGNYGYIHANYDPAGSVYMFTRGAYETSGAAIAAGVIPEPASIALLLVAGVYSLGIRRSARTRSASECYCR